MSISNGYTKEQKIKLAKLDNTSVEMIDELLLDEKEIRATIYNRKDFYELKEVLRNFNKEEYDFFNISIKEGLVKERLKFVFFKAGLCFLGLIFMLVLLFMVANMQVIN